MDIILIDNSNQEIETIRIAKPKSYQELLNQLDKFVNLPDYYEILILDKNNKKIIIDNEQKYKLAEDLLFIHELLKNVEEQSLFSINYNELPESKKEKLDEKYICILCSAIIKKENPYFCYQCQKIFHEKCLKKWDKMRKSQNKKLTCPHCRNELSLEKWNKKLDYEENRKEHANLINKINEFGLNSSNMNNGIDIIKIKKLIKRYEKYIEKTFKIFINILDKINYIHSLLKLKNNNELNSLVKNFPLNLRYLEIDNISNLIDEELTQIKKYIKNDYKLEAKDIKNSRNLKNGNYILAEIYIEEDDIDGELRILNSFEEYKRSFNEDELQTDYLYKNEKEIKENCEIKINNHQIPFCYYYEFKEKGKYIIQYSFKNKISKSNYMFYDCKSLININLSNFNTENITDMSYMFYNCYSLNSINLSNFNTKKVENMKYMFYNCDSLTNINLSYFDTKHTFDMSYMFHYCNSLTSIDCSSFKTENVYNMSGMFSLCSSLTSINLSNFNTEDVKYMDLMFKGCKSLKKLNLFNFKIQRIININGIFEDCSSLKKENIIVNDINFQKKIDEIIY